MFGINILYCVCRIKLCIPTYALEESTMRGNEFSFSVFIGFSYFNLHFPIPHRRRGNIGFRVDVVINIKKLQNHFENTIIIR